MFLLYLLGCRTSIQFDFLAVLVVFVFKFVVVLWVVQGGTVCLPAPPSRLEVDLLDFYHMLNAGILEVNRTPTVCSQLLPDTKI